MRLSVILLVAALLGVLAGGWLTGRPGLLGLGLALVFDSLAAGAWALLRDDGKPAQVAVPRVEGTPTLHDVLERARRSG